MAANPGGFAQYRRILRHAVIYGLGNLASRLVGFLLLPLYTRALTPQEYGILAIINVSIALLTAVLNVGMTSAIFRQYFREEDARRKDQVIATAFVFLTALSMVAVLVLGLAARPISLLLAGDGGYSPHVRLALAGLFFELGLFTPRSLLRAREMSGQFALTAAGRLVVNLVLNIVFVAHMRLGVYGVLLGNAVAAGAVYLLLLPMVVRRVGRGVSLQALKQLLAFGAPLTPAMVGAFLLASSDRYFIRYFHGLDAVSVYEVAYKIAGALSVFVVQPFYLAWPAVMWSMEGTPDAERTYVRVLTYLVGVTTFCALGISLFGRELIGLIATDAYSGGVWVLPLLAASYVFSASYFVLNTGASLAGRTGLISLAVGMAVGVNVALNFVLIPPYGILGAAVSTVASYWVMAASMHRFSQRLRPMRFEWRRVAWIGLIGMALFGMGSLAGEFMGVASVWVRFGLLAGFCVLIVNRVFLDEDEWRAVSARVIGLPRLIRTRRGEIPPARNG